MNSAPVRLDQVSKFYEEGKSRLKILQRVTNEFTGGKFSVLLGKSGSGKSTLLNLISGIDTPSSGDVWIGKTPITRLSERERTIFRRDHIGIVFQFFNLIPTLNVLENVTLPLDLGGNSTHKNRQRALALLELVGLQTRYSTMPDLLSGGEQQRIAIARAVVHEPDIVLADEPTGNLDAETAKAVLNLLIQLTRGAGKTLIVATHSQEIISLADEMYTIKNGQLIALDEKNAPLRVSK
ncbi:MAG: ABC transporter ATP-binding protein [Thermodesulfobacteriota bacterium]